ncbi:MAG: 2-hydroxyhepta-2,4-diene-1,7-dioate isomerase, partial [Acidimicrobiia bacterium]
MRLATIRTDSGTRCVRVDDESAVETGHPDVGALLADPDWRSIAATASGPQHDVDALDHAPLVIAPEKVICVGLNYLDHIAETGRPRP